MSLLQVELKRHKTEHYEWAMLVGCILLNRTSWRVAKPLFWQLLRRWPDPASLAAASYGEVLDLIEPLGLYARAYNLVDMSEAYVNEWDGVDPRELPGVGVYAYHSWRIFVKGDTSFKPKDKKLREYVEALDDERLTD